MNVAGAYWKGQEGNPQLQRIYAVAFFTQKEPTRICTASRKQAPRSPPAWHGARPLQHPEEAAPD